MITEVGSYVNTGAGTAPTTGVHGIDIQLGDVIILFVSTNAGNLSETANLTDNNGGTPTTRDLNIEQVNGQTNSSAFFSRVTGASEPAAYAYTSSISYPWSVIIRVFRGVHSSIWDVVPATANTGSGTTGTTATAPSIDTITASAVALFWAVTDGAITYSNVTNSFTDLIISGTGYNPAVATAIKTIPSAGAVGSTAATLSASNDWYCMLMALKPKSTSYKSFYPAFKRP